MKDERRFALCACGAIYDLDSGIPLGGVELERPDKSKGDKEKCFACYLTSGASERDGWPDR